MRETSRKEKRKELRAAKKQNKFSCWSQHQKFKKTVPLESKSSAIVGSRARSVEDTKTKLNGVPKKRTRSEEQSSKEVFIKQGKKKNLKGQNMIVSDSKKTKTKFEKYLEMEMNKGVSAEFDLEMERKLAKKLKVKAGKLGGFDDGMDLLFEGISSGIDYGIDESMNAKIVESSEHVVSNKKKKKRKLMNGSELPKEMENCDAELSDKVESSMMMEGSRGQENEEFGQESNGIDEQEGTQNDYAVSEPSNAETSPNVATPAVTNDKYVPRWLRSCAENDESSQFRRQVKGLLNNLSDSNVETITGEISTIFQSVGRSTGCQIIGEEVLISSRETHLKEQHAALYAAFVAGMASLVGIDFSAKLIAALAKAFEEEYSKEDSISVKNLSLLLSQLCIFGVCSSDLLYDLLSVLSKRLMELDVSAILRILESCGMKLRGDDPTSMKDFILGIQQRVQELKTHSGSTPNQQLSKRMELMLGTIGDIKNNRKRSREDSEPPPRLKKWLQKLKVENVQLRGLKWCKLLDPQKKGQWWLSGDGNMVAKDSIVDIASKIDREVLEAQKLLQLASAQRMNTDSRKAIFCIIMSSEDYIDAFEKILRLDLPGKQDREIMRVLVECCLQEKVFNKYYSVLASKLCSHDKNHKFTLQYCLWDHFKQLESMELSRSMNLARFTAELVASFTLSLAVLKSVDLGDPKFLNPKQVMHFRMLFEAIFERTDDVIWNIFTRIAIAPELESLRTSLEFFIKQYLASTSKFPGKLKIVKKALNNVAGILV